MRSLGVTPPPLPMATASPRWWRGPPGRCAGTRRSEPAIPGGRRRSSGLARGGEVVLVAGAAPLQDRQQVGLGDQQDGVAVLRPRGRVAERRGAAAAGLVDDDELLAECRRRLHHHHPGRDVAAAADAGMGHDLDRPRREFLLGARRGGGQHGGDDAERRERLQAWLHWRFPVFLAALGGRSRHRFDAKPGAVNTSPVDLSRPGRQGLRPLRSRAEAMQFKPASRALSRFTVLDLTRVRSGPTCVRQLADWGANVIKIETPEGLEKGDAPGGPRHGSDFQNLHRNKRSLSLNLKTAAGLDVLKRLVAKADVLVENYRPDVKHRLGIDHETLKAVNPRLVYASISGFGQDGPYRERPGFDQIAQGMGGLMSITGLPDQGPVRVGIPIADLSAGLYCSLGI